MSTEFLRLLFIACSDEDSGAYRDGLNLSELYERIEDTIEAERAFSETRKKAGLTFEAENSISGAAYATIRAYELQGFINGFRLCAMLSRELREKGAAS